MEKCYRDGGSRPLQDWLWSGAHHQSPQRSQPAMSAPSASTHKIRPIIAAAVLAPKSLAPEPLRIEIPMTPSFPRHYSKFRPAGGLASPGCTASAPDRNTGFQKPAFQPATAQ